jgi:hypothetical protein
VTIEYIGTSVADYAATYQTNADGTPVPFTSRWRVDAPGVPVAVYEDATGSLLGSGVSNASPEASGPHAGWYLASVPITSWSSSAGALLPTFYGVAGFTAPTISAVLTIPTFAGVGDFIAPDYSAGSAFNLPTFAGAGALNAPTFSAVVSLPTMAGAGGFAAPTIEEGGGGGTTFEDDFNRANGAIGSSWAAVTGLSAPDIVSNEALGSQEAAAYVVASPFNADVQDQSAEIENGSYARGVRVRQATGSDSAYMARFWDDEGATLELFRVVNGTATALGLWIVTTSPTCIRLRATGQSPVSVIVETRETSGGALTQRISYNDSHASRHLSGRPGLQHAGDNFKAEVL